MKKYDSYKESGVEWIGEIPNHWILGKIKFSDTVIMGQSPLSDDCNSEGNGLPFLQGNAEFGKLNPTPKLYCEIPNKIADINDVLLSVRAPVGALNIANQKFGIGRGLCAIRHQKSNYKYIYYWLLHSNKELDSISTGSTFKAISLDDVKNINFPSMDIYEQTTIANYLDHKLNQIDHLIAKKEQFIQLLEEERVAVINQAVTKGLDPSVAMKDSGIEWLGEIPEHWEVSILKHIIGTTKGFAFKSDQFTDKGVPIVKASDIKNKSIRLETTHFISEENAMEFNNVKLSAGDILISTVGSTPDVINSAVGQIGKVPIELDGALLNQNTVRLEVSDKKKIISKYLFFLIQNENYRTHLNLNAHGTANQASLKLVDLLSYKVALPPLNEQLTIVKHSKAENQRIQTIIIKTQQEIELLKEYKTALISEVVTGKVDVRQVVLN